MLRKALLGLTASVLIGGGLAASAEASSSPIRLYMGGGAAFAVLGHSCGGIQQKVYVNGFAPNGYPQGNVFLSTRCGGSGKGGGYKTTEYTATAGVVWTWYGETRSYSAPGGALEAFAAEDTHGDRVYNEGTAAWLVDGEPPIKPPAPPTGIGASVGLYEPSENIEYLRLTVGWTVDPETAGLITSSTIKATPKTGGTTLEASVIPYFSSGAIDRVAPNTTYIVTVTSTDAEGTSAPSEAIEIKTPNEDGEAGKEKPATTGCGLSSGTIKLSPGLTATPHFQNITIKGTFGECGGALGMESGAYTEHLRSTEEMTCSVLQSASLEPTVEAGSLSVKWAPTEEGKSTGSLVIPITEAPLTGLTGTLEGGPFAAPTPVRAATVSESFTGGPTCGQAEGKKKAKAVKSGTFSTSEVEFG